MRSRPISCAALAPDEAQGEVFNVAVGERTSLNQLFGLLRDGLAEHQVHYDRGAGLRAEFGRATCAIPRPTSPRPKRCSATAPPTTSRRGCARLCLITSSGPAKAKRRSGAARCRCWRSRCLRGGEGGGGGGDRISPAGQGDGGAEEQVGADHRDRGEVDPAGEQDAEVDRVEAQVLANAFANAEHGVRAHQQGRLGGGGGQIGHRVETPWVGHAHTKQGPCQDRERLVSKRFRVGDRRVTGAGLGICATQGWWISPILKVAKVAKVAKVRESATISRWAEDADGEIEVGEGEPLRTDLSAQVWGV